MKKLEQEHMNLLNSQCAIESQHRALLRQYEDNIPLVTQTADTIRSLQQANLQMKEYISLMNSNNRIYSDLSTDRY